MHPPRPALRRFLRLYRAGAFWESHEVLEGPWRESRDDFTQALILLASAWVHHGRRNAHGVTAQLAKARARLRGLPDRHAGFDIAALRRCCAEVPAVVGDHPRDWPDRVRPLELAPPVAPAAGPVTVEACVTSVDEARAAVAAGAGRLELCRELAVGGLTPAPDVLREVLAAVPVPVHVLIRPRDAGWVVGAAELDTMRRQIRAARAAGAAGVVVGALDAEGRVDRRAVDALVGEARRDGRGRGASRGRAGSPTSVTFHRAFDHAADPRRAFGGLGEAGIDRVLTAGAATSARAGTGLLLELARTAGPVVLAGGGVRGDHVAALVDATDVREVHARARAVPDLCAALRAAGLMDEAPRGG